MNLAKACKSKESSLVTTHCGRSSPAPPVSTSAQDQVIKHVAATSSSGVEGVSAADAWVLASSQGPRAAGTRDFRPVHVSGFFTSPTV
jgi:hypothetical protein